MNSIENSAGAPRGRVIGHSRAEGAGVLEGRSAARTGGASDLRRVSLPELDDMSREGWARAAARPGQTEEDGFITVHPRVTP